MAQPSNSEQAANGPGAEILAPNLSNVHVLTLTPFFPSRENDVNGCFIKEPLDSLVELGVSSTVIAATPLHHPKRHAHPTAPATWVRYPQIPGTRGLTTAGRILYARLLLVAQRLHRTRPIQIIHAHAALPCGKAAALLAQRLQVPFVVTVHGLDVFNDQFARGAVARSLRLASMSVYQSAHTTICVSERVRHILRETMPTGVSSAVVYNGANPDLFSPGATSSSQPNELLAVGNLIPSKGHDLVLRGIHRLTPDFPQLQCRIIGEGPERPRLQALARELGITERIHFLGRQSRTEVAAAMRRSSIFVLPSRSEGLGCVYLEAMACAKPVVACLGQGIDEVIQHEKNGWLISPDSLDELVRGLSVLLRAPDVASRMGLAAGQTVLTGLTLAHQAQRLAAVYRETAAR